jgi:ATP-dependent DNA helicase PIF1
MEQLPRCSPSEDPISAASQPPSAVDAAPMAVDPPLANEVHAEVPNPPIKLSKDQQKVLDMVKSGQNVFFTGPAGEFIRFVLPLFSTSILGSGTGKSVLLREIINHFRLPTGEISSSIAITASTGIAGLNIGGSTVHSFAGVGLAKRPAEQLAGFIWNSKNLRERWQKVRVLIIDESKSNCSKRSDD